MSKVSSIVICYIIFAAFGFNILADEYSTRTSLSTETVEKKISLPGHNLKDARKPSNSLELPTSTAKMQPCGDLCSSASPTLAPKRNRRIVEAKGQLSSEQPAVTSHSINMQAVLSPFPTVDPLREKKKASKIQRKLNKANRSNKSVTVKKMSSTHNGDDIDKMDVAIEGLDKKGRKKLQLKKTQLPVREGQTPRRLRQHMQHKKKVKHFLQKRIQEQIEQRSQKQESKI